LWYGVTRHAWPRRITPVGTDGAKDSANRNSTTGRGADAPSVPDPEVQVGQVRYRLRFRCGLQGRTLRPDDFLGSWVLELTAHSEVLQQFDGGTERLGSMDAEARASWIRSGPPAATHAFAWRTTRSTGSCTRSGLAGSAERRSRSVDAPGFVPSLFGRL
jgi:hypothetical protein